MALLSWTTGKKALITTALTHEKAFSFYFQGVNHDFYTLAKSLTDVQFNSELVQIAFPQIYRHRPLLNVALYHELGHFLDVHHGIVNLSLLAIPVESLPLPGLNFDEMTSEQINIIATSHRREYFADIFAASYVGNAYKDFLDAFAKNNQVSWTHPATNARLDLIDSFLSGAQNDIIDLFQTSLTKKGLRKLEINFLVPDVLEAFNNARPYKIQNEAELHGIFEAGTTYLKQTQISTDSTNSWTHSTGEATTERIINGLIEKSIRNSMIVGNWRTNEPLT
ncbi:hypothetical protein C7H79_15460 [Nitrosomonas supralitoralis]|uniref:Uncharacterized protein n=2 Tax=Nitrosomonas supralitoralis TaxID=2116706 RepID=A0A2P7NRI3_9PROT|nr:hypothetical protein C7H79_15460 [Nitrosomonas supralitoralis]